MVIPFLVLNYWWFTNIHLYNFFCSFSVSVLRRSALSRASVAPGSMPAHADWAGHSCRLRQRDSGTFSWLPTILEISLVKDQSWSLSLSGCMVMWMIEKGKEQELHCVMVLIFMNMNYCISLRQCCKISGFKSKVVKQFIDCISEWVIALWALARSQDATDRSSWFQY